MASSARDDRGPSPLRLFVSYRREDEDTYGLVRYLSANIPNRFASQTGQSLQLFVDTELPGGAEWQRKIRVATKECDFFLPLLSIAYLKSPQCRDEAQLFLDSRTGHDRKISIVPIAMFEPSRLRQYCPPEARSLLEALDTFNWVHAEDAIDSGFTGSDGPRLLRRLVAETLVPFWDEKQRSAPVQPEEPAALDRSSEVPRPSTAPQEPPATGLEADDADDVSRIARAIVRHSQPSLAAGADVQEFRRGARQAVSTITEVLTDIAVQIGSRSDLVLTASDPRRDAGVGETIAEALDAVGLDGLVEIEESSNPEPALSLAVAAGSLVDAGCISRDLLGGPGQREVVLVRPYVLLADCTISDAMALRPFLEKAHVESRDLLVIAQGVEGEALATIQRSNALGKAKAVAVKAPEFGNRRREILNDIACLTDARTARSTEDLGAGEVGISLLGQARKAIVGRTRTTVLDGAGKPEYLIRRLAQIRAECKATDSEYDRGKLLRRIANLTGGRATITVGGNDEERRARRLSVEAGLRRARAAIQNGVVPGDGVGLAYSASEARGSRTITGLAGDRAAGAEAVFAGIETSLSRPAGATTARFEPFTFALFTLQKAATRAMEALQSSP